MTLVEVIVVMAIAAALMSLMLTGLAGVRRRARAVTCTANLKGIGDLMAVYANENRGRVVPYGSTDPAELEDRWYVDLLAIAISDPGKTSFDLSGPDPHLPRDVELFFCPEDRNPVFTPNDLSYGLNADVMDADGNPYTSQTPEPEVDGEPDVYFFSDIINPGEFILAADTGLIAQGDYSDRPMSSWITSPALRSSNGGWPRPASGLHRGEANVLFGDLHVAPMEARHPAHDLRGHINDDTASEAARNWTLENR